MPTQSFRDWKHHLSLRGWPCRNSEPHLSSPRWTRSAAPLVPARSGPGANPAVLQLMNSYPLPNGNLAGDGYNTPSFTWSAPNPLNLGTYLARVDYSLSDKHRFFVRGNLQNDHESLASTVSRASRQAAIIPTTAKALPWERPGAFAQA